MRLGRKPRQVNCPICGGPLIRANGKSLCELCRIEIKGSSVKPLSDRTGYDSLETHPNG